MALSKKQAMRMMMEDGEKVVPIVRDVPYDLEYIFFDSVRNRFMYRSTDGRVYPIRKYLLGDSYKIYTKSKVFVSILEMEKGKHYKNDNKLIVCPSRLQCGTFEWQHPRTCIWEPFTMTEFDVNKKEWYEVIC